ncbi:MAG TPA: carbon monoxide dehydrogenase subunit G [Steroidobacteraceae bacterium]|nr:carbon monoxide dehydrogenase subunit G [Steroidobacteraceae bacterium]
MKGERLLAADRATAWRLLNDPDTLKQCIPGCESMTATGDGSYEIAMTAAVGPVKARFKGKMSLADVEPPERYRLVFEGQSAQAGFARGQARVALETLSPLETRLSYAATAQVGGKLAQIGSRLIDAAAAATAERFFDAFTLQLAAAMQPPSAAAAGAAAPASAPAPPARLGLWRWVRSLLRHLLARRAS